MNAMIEIKPCFVKSENTKDEEKTIIAYRNKKQVSYGDTEIKTNLC